MRVSNTPVINVTIKQHLEEIFQDILGPNIKVSNSLVNVIIKAVKKNKVVKNIINISPC